MPRIYNSYSDPLDFCIACFPNEQTAKENYDFGEVGPDNRGNCFSYDEEHPLYSETDYNCEICKKRLTDKDNYHL